MSYTNISCPFLGAVSRKPARGHRARTTNMCPAFSSVPPGLGFGSSHLCLLPLPVKRKDQHQGKARGEIFPPPLCPKQPDCTWGWCKRDEPVLGLCGPRLALTADGDEGWSGACPCNSGTRCGNWIPCRAVLPCGLAPFPARSDAGASEPHAAVVLNRHVEFL